MEVITLPGYTEEEKVEIGNQFLIPKMLEEHGLSPSNLTIRKDSLKVIIRSYTREAGVRNLKGNWQLFAGKLQKTWFQAKAKSNSDA